QGGDIAGDGTGNGAGHDEVNASGRGVHLRQEEEVGSFTGQCRLVLEPLILDRAVAESLALEEDIRSDAHRLVGRLEQERRLAHESCGGNQAAGGGQDAGGVHEKSLVSCPHTRLDRTRRTRPAPRVRTSSSCSQSPATVRWRLSTPPIADP